MNEISTTITINGRTIELNHNDTMQLGRIIGSISGCGEWIYKLYDEIYEPLDQQQRRELCQSPYSKDMVPYIRVNKDY